jgi:hypothetical protein
MNRSEAVIHPIEQVVVWGSCHFRRIVQLLTHQQRVLEVAVAHLEVKAQQRSCRQLWQGKFLRAEGLAVLRENRLLLSVDNPCYLAW